MADEFDPKKYKKFLEGRKASKDKIKPGRPAQLLPTNAGITSPMETASRIGERAGIGLQEGLTEQPISPDIGVPGALGFTAGESAPPMAGAAAGVAVAGTLGLNPLTMPMAAAGAAGIGATMAELTRKELLELSKKKDKTAFNDKLADAAVTGALYGTGEAAIAKGAQLYKSTIRPFAADAFPSFFNLTSLAQPTAIKRMINNPSMMGAVETVKQIPEHKLVTSLLTTLNHGKTMTQKTFGQVKSKFKEQFGDMMFNLQPVIQYLEKELVEAGAPKPGQKLAKEIKSKLTGAEIGQIHKYIKELGEMPVLSIESLSNMRTRIAKEASMKYDKNVMSSIGSDGSRIIKGMVAKMKEQVSSTEQRLFNSNNFSNALENYAEKIGLYEELGSMMTNRRARGTILKAFKQGEGSAEWELLHQAEQVLAVGYKQLTDLLDQLTVKQFEPRVHPTSVLRLPRATGRAIQYGVPGVQKGERFMGAVTPTLKKILPAIFDTSSKQAEVAKKQRRDESYK